MKNIKVVLLSLLMIVVGCDTKQVMKQGVGVGNWQVDEVELLSYQERSIEAFLTYIEPYLSSKGEYTTSQEAHRLVAILNWMNKRQMLNYKRMFEEEVDENTYIQLKQENDWLFQQTILLACIVKITLEDAGQQNIAKYNQRVAEDKQVYFVGIDIKSIQKHLNDSYLFSFQYKQRRVNQPNTVEYAHFENGEEVPPIFVTTTYEENGLVRYIDFNSINEWANTLASDNALHQIKLYEFKYEDDEKSTDEVDLIEKVYGEQIPIQNKNNSLFYSEIGSRKLAHIDLYYNSYIGTSTVSTCIVQAPTDLQAVYKWLTFKRTGFYGLGYEKSMFELKINEYIATLQKRLDDELKEGDSNDETIYGISEVEEYQQKISLIQAMVSMQPISFDSYEYEVFRGVVNDLNSIIYEVNNTLPLDARYYRLEFINGKLRVENGMEAW